MKNLPQFSRLDHARSATSLHNFGHNQGWVGTRRELSSLPRASKREWPEKLRRPWGSNPRPCAPSCSLWLHLQSDSSGLRSSGFCCSAPWYSGWLVGAPWGGRHSYGRGSNPAFLKGISIQTTPAPLLGLQHAANVPGLLGLGLVEGQSLTFNDWNI